MKRLIFPLLLLLALLGLSNKGSAQVLGIDSITVNTFGLPDTILINDAYNHTAFVNNQTATPYTGTIWLMAAVDTGSGIVDIDTVGFANVTNFTQNDTVSISYNETYSFANSYKLGGNIVVVWPAAATGSTVDSLFQPVYILNQTGLKGLTDVPTTEVYPNPFRDYIYLKSSVKNAVKQVRIFDLCGRIIYNGAFESTLNVGHLPAGIFLLELELEGHQRKRVKLIKE